MIHSTGMGQYLTQGTRDFRGIRRFFPSFDPYPSQNRSWLGCPQRPKSRPLFANTTSPDFLLLVCRSKHSSSPGMIGNASPTLICRVHGSSINSMNTPGSIGSFQWRLQHAQISNTKMAKHGKSAFDKSIQTVRALQLCITKYKSLTRMYECQISAVREFLPRSVISQRLRNRPLLPRQFGSIWISKAYCTGRNFCTRTKQWGDVKCEHVDLQSPLCTVQTSQHVTALSWQRHFLGPPSCSSTPWQMSALGQLGPSKSSKIWQGPGCKHHKRRLSKLNHRSWGPKFFRCSTCCLWRLYFREICQDMLWHCRCYKNENAIIIHQYPSLQGFRSSSPFLLTIELKTILVHFGCTVFIAQLAAPPVSTHNCKTGATRGLKQHHHTTSIPPCPAPLLVTSIRGKGGKSSTASSPSKWKSFSCFHTNLETWTHN